MSRVRRHPDRAIVIGGSMAGLFTALLLRKQGIAAEIYERNPVELAGRGAGIVTHDALHVALNQIGIEVGEDIGIPVRGRRTLAQDGSIIGDFVFPQVNTSWDRLFRLLRFAMPPDTYHLGKSLAGLVQEEHSVIAKFSDGTSAETPLLIGADGFRSTVRHIVAPSIAPIYTGYVGWRGLVNEALLSRSTRDVIGNFFTFCLPPGEQMLGYPVAGGDETAGADRRRYNFVWYRPAEERTELSRLLTDDTGKLHEISIPPPLISKTVLTETRAAAEAQLAPQLAEVVRKTDQIFFQPIYDLTVDRMAYGRVALLGDAAFVARPHVGAGVTKAAEDALSLAKALGQSTAVETALRQFEAERVPIGHKIIARARQLGAYMQAQIKTPEEQAAAERHRSPAAIMKETASLAFMDEASDAQDAHA